MRLESLRRLHQGGMGVQQKGGQVIAVADAAVPVDDDSAQHDFGQGVLECLCPAFLKVQLTLDQQGPLEMGAS